MACAKVLPMTFVQGKRTGVRDGSGAVAPVPLGHGGGCLFLCLLPRPLTGVGGAEWPGLGTELVCGQVAKTRWRESWVMRAGIRGEQPPPRGTETDSWGLSGATLGWASN